MRSKVRSRKNRNSVSITQNRKNQRNQRKTSRRNQRKNSRRNQRKASRRNQRKASRRNHRKASRRTLKGGSGSGSGIDIDKFELHDILEGLSLERSLKSKLLKYVLKIQKHTVNMNDVTPFFKDNNGNWHVSDSTASKFVSVSDSEDQRVIEDGLHTVQCIIGDTTAAVIGLFNTTKALSIFDKRRLESTKSLTRDALFTALDDNSSLIKGEGKIATKLILSPHPPKVMLDFVNKKQLTAMFYGEDNQTNKYKQTEPVNKTDIQFGPHFHTAQTTLNVFEYDKWKFGAIDPSGYSAEFLKPFDEGKKILKMFEGDSDDDLINKLNDIIDAAEPTYLISNQEIFFKKNVKENPTNVHIIEEMYSGKGEEVIKEMITQIQNIANTDPLFKDGLGLYLIPAIFYNNEKNILISRKLLYDSIFQNYEQEDIKEKLKNINTDEWIKYINDLNTGFKFKKSQKKVGGEETLKFTLNNVDIEVKKVEGKDKLILNHGSNIADLTNLYDPTSKDITQKYCVFYPGERHANLDFTVDNVRAFTSVRPVINRELPAHAKTFFFPIINP